MPAEITKQPAYLAGLRGMSFSPKPMTPEEEELQRSREELRNIYLGKYSFIPESTTEVQRYSPDDPMFTWGASKYDNPVEQHSLSASQMQDTRYNNQGTFDVLANGFVKMAGTAATTFLSSTIGLGVGLVSAITDGKMSSFWDNPFSRAMTEIDDSLEESFKNYQSTEQQEAPWWERLGTATFWADSFIKNVGFTLGAVASGYMFSGGLGLIAKAAKVAGTATSASKTVIPLVTSVLSSAGEGSIEAKNAMREYATGEYARVESEMLPQWETTQAQYTAEINELRERLQNTTSPDQRAAIIARIEHLGNLYQTDKADFDKRLQLAKDEIKERAHELGNYTFWGNMVLLSAGNFIQFGKGFNKSFANARRMEQMSEKSLGSGMIEDLGERSLRSKIQDIAKNGEKEALREGEKLGEFGVSKWTTGMKRAGAILKHPITEGNEEMAQGLISTASSYRYQSEDVDDYWKSRYDLNASKRTEEGLRGWGEALSSALNDTYGNARAWEEGFVGALTGGMGMVSFHGADARSKDKKGIGKYIGWEGGIINELRDANKEIRNARELANDLNSRINSDKFYRRMHDATSHAYYQNIMDEAAKANNKLKFKNASDQQFAEDVASFVRAGRTDDLLAIADIMGQDLNDEDIDTYVQMNTQKVSAEEDAANKRQPLQDKWDNMSSRAEQMNEDVKRARSDYKALQKRVAKENNQLEYAKNRQGNKKAKKQKTLADVRNRKGKKNQNESGTPEQRRLQGKIDKNNERLNAAEAALQEKEDALFSHLQEMAALEAQINEVQGVEYTRNPYLDENGNRAVTEDGQIMDNDYIRNEIKNNAIKYREQVQEFIDAANEVQQLSGGKLSNEQEDHLTWLNYLSRRSNQRAEDILSRLRDQLPSQIYYKLKKGETIESLTQKISNSQHDIWNDATVSDKPIGTDKAVPKGYVTLDISNMTDDNFKRFFLASLSTQKDENGKEISPNVDMLNRYIEDNFYSDDELSGSFFRNQRAGDKLVEDLNDALTLAAQAMDYYKTLNEYLENPGLSDKKKAEAQKEAERQKKDEELHTKKVNDFVRDETFDDDALNDILEDDDIDDEIKDRAKEARKIKKRAQDIGEELAQMRADGKISQESLNMFTEALNSLMSDASSANDITIDALEEMMDALNGEDWRDIVNEIAADEDSHNADESNDDIMHELREWENELNGKEALVEAEKIKNAKTDEKGEETGHDPVDKNKKPATPKVEPLTKDEYPPTPSQEDMEKWPEDDRFLNPAPDPMHDSAVFRNTTRRVHYHKFQQPYHEWYMEQQKAQGRSEASIEKDPQYVRSKILYNLLNTYGAFDYVENPANKLKGKKVHFKIVDLSQQPGGEVLKEDRNQKDYPNNHLAILYVLENGQVIGDMPYTGFERPSTRQNINKKSLRDFQKHLFDRYEKEGNNALEMDITDEESYITAQYAGMAPYSFEKSTPKDERKEAETHKLNEITGGKTTLGTLTSEGIVLKSKKHGGSKTQIHIPEGLKLGTPFLILEDASGKQVAVPFSMPAFSVEAYKGSKIEQFIIKALDLMEKGAQIGEKDATIPLTGAGVKDTINGRALLSAFLQFGKMSAVERAADGSYIDVKYIPVNSPVGTVMKTLRVNKDENGKWDLSAFEGMNMQVDNHCLGMKIDGVEYGSIIGDSATTQLRTGFDGHTINSWFSVAPMVEDKSNKGKFKPNRSYEAFQDEASKAMQDKQQEKLQKNRTTYFFEKEVVEPVTESELKGKKKTVIGGKDKIYKVTKMVWRNTGRGDDRTIKGEATGILMQAFIESDGSLTIDFGVYKEVNGERKFVTADESGASYYCSVGSKTFKYFALKGQDITISDKFDTVKVEQIVFNPDGTATFKVRAYNRRTKETSEDVDYVTIQQENALNFIGMRNPDLGAGIGIHFGAFKKEDFAGRKKQKTEKKTDPLKTAIENFNKAIKAETKAPVSLYQLKEQLINNRIGKGTGTTNIVKALIMFDWFYADTASKEDKKLFDDIRKDLREQGYRFSPLYGKPYQKRDAKGNTKNVKDSDALVVATKTHEDSRLPKGVTIVIKVNEPYIIKNGKIVHYGKVEVAVGTGEALYSGKAKEKKQRVTVTDAISKFNSEVESKEEKPKREDLEKMLDSDNIYDQYIAIMQLNQHYSATKDGKRVDNAKAAAKAKELGVAVPTLKGKQFRGDSERVRAVAVQEDSRLPEGVEVVVDVVVPFVRSAEKNDEGKFGIEQQGEVVIARGTGPSIDSLNNRKRKVAEVEDDMKDMPETEQEEGPEDVPNIYGNDDVVDEMADELNGSKGLEEEVKEIESELNSDDIDGIEGLDENPNEAPDTTGLSENPESKPEIDSDAHNTPTKPVGNNRREAGDRSGNNRSNRRRRVVDSKHRKKADIAKERRWLAKVLPQYSESDRLRIVHGLIQTVRDGKNAWGVFEGACITLSDLAAAGTLYHEAFHAVVHNLMTNEELRRMWTAAREKYGDLGAIALEEKLAEDFRRYTQQLERPVLGTLIRMYRNIKNWIKAIVGLEESDIDQLFQAINSGYFSDREVLEDPTSDEEWQKIYESADMELQEQMDSTMNSYQYEFLKVHDKLNSWKRLTAEERQHLKEDGITKEVYEQMSVREREQMRHCLG